MKNIANKNSIIISVMFTMVSVSSDVLVAIDTLAEEKNISKNVIISAIEESFRESLSKYYTIDGDFVAKMNLENGKILSFEKKLVQEHATQPNEISLSDAKKIKPDVVSGEFVLIPLQAIETDLLPVSSLKKNILSAIRCAEREIEYNEYKKREGEIIVGTVKKTSPLNIIVNLGNKTEAVLRKNDLIKSDNYNAGDKIKAYIKEVIRSDKDICQILLSRTDNNFLAMLIAENCVEVQDGMVDIKSVARQCGIKAKVAVVANDSRLDAVGSCIGARGSRIKPVIDELKGERIDIVYWDRDLVNFAKNAIAPAKAVYGKYDELSNSVELVVADDQLKLAIGKGGVNVRLASQLIGCNISVIAESEKKRIVQEKFNKDLSLMASALDVEEAIAQFFVSSNICTPAELVNVGVDSLVKSGVFNEEIAQELVNRASVYVKTQEENAKKELKQLGVDNDMLQLDGMTTEIALALARANIKTVSDVADLSNDEFVDICGEQFSDVANQIIMVARKIIYNF